MSLSKEAEAVLVPMSIIFGLLFLVAFIGGMKKLFNCIRAKNQIRESMKIVDVTRVYESLPDVVPDSDNN